MQKRIGVVFVSRRNTLRSILAEACLQAIHNLNLAHGWTVSAVRAAAPGAELGNIVSLSPVHVPHDDAAHREALVLGEALWRHVMVDPLWLGRYRRSADADDLCIDVERLRASDVAPGTLPAQADFSGWPMQAASAPA